MFKGSRGAVSSAGGINSTHKNKAANKLLGLQMGKELDRSGHG